jgi:hypothetical protein
MPTLAEARLDDPITRAEMAKMLVVFITNISSLRGSDKGVDEAIQEESNSNNSARNDDK